LWCLPSMKPLRGNWSLLPMSSMTMIQGRDHSCTTKATTLWGATISLPSPQPPESPVNNAFLVHGRVKFSFTSLFVDSEFILL
jgi:hypothetical protein